MRTSKIGCSLLFFVSCLMVASVHAQDSCSDGRVCVSGNRLKAYDPWGNDPDGGFGGGGSAGGSGGGSPETSAGSGSGTAPAPTPKTPEQKKEAREKCEKTREEDRSIAVVMYQSSIGVCATGLNTWYGYLQEQWMRVGVPVVLNGGPQDCASVTTRTFQDRLATVEFRRNTCVDLANKD